jgi:hypothetical protein
VGMNSETVNTASFQEWNEGGGGGGKNMIQKGSKCFIWAEVLLVVKRLIYRA